MGCVVSQDELLQRLNRLRQQGKRIVFTNGCFDWLHAGHVRYLKRARALGDVLVVGLNSDASVRALKGEGRPLLRQEHRAEVLAALACVDYVTVFDDLTPLRLIQAVQPDVLVKGGDWPVERIVGREVVEARGGEVVSIPVEVALSTSRLLERVRGRGIEEVD